MPYFRNAYAISADDGLLREEKIAELRREAERAGFSERRALQLDEQDALLTAVQNPSLFAARVLIEIRHHQPKLNHDGETFLAQLLNIITADILLLIALPYLPKAQRKKKWVRILETKGQLLVLYTPQGRDYITWLEHRARSLRLAISPEALALIAEKNAGNLHTATQELEKLAYRYGAEKVDYAAVLDAISDDSHYETFSLSDSALRGDVISCKRIMHHLRDEQVPPYLLIGILARDLRSLWALSHNRNSGVQPFRRQLFETALKRFNNPKRLLFLLVMAAQADRAAKGSSNEDIWQLLEGLALRMAGTPTPSLIHTRTPIRPT